MEQTKGRKAFYIGLSVLIALLVWFYANGDTEVEISVNDVPIEFTNEDTSLADKGLMLLSYEEEAIDLKLSMPRSTYFKLDPGKIRIVVDLSSVTTTGTQTITYSVLYPRGPRGELLSSSITQKEPTVRSTTIEIGELFRKNVEIRCKVVGNVAEGYIAGTVHRHLDALAGRMDAVRADELVAEIVQLKAQQLHDRGGRVFNVQRDLRVAHLHDVDLRAIDEIKLDTLSLADLKAAETFTYDIPLPDGVDNLSGVTSVTLTILFDDIDSLTVDATQFGYENLTTERDVTVVTSTLSVTLRGTSTALAQVNEENLRVVAIWVIGSPSVMLWTVFRSAAQPHGHLIAADGADLRRDAAGLRGAHRVVSDRLLCLLRADLRGAALCHRHCGVLPRHRAGDPLRPQAEARGRAGVHHHTNPVAQICSATFCPRGIGSTSGNASASAPSTADCATRSGSATALPRASCSTTILPF